MKFRKLNTGNYFGNYKSYYAFIYKRPHGKWCCVIGYCGEWLYREGYHGTYFTTLKKATTWVDQKLNDHLELNGASPLKMLKAIMSGQ